VADDIEKELTAVPHVSELVAGWSAEWNAAKNKGSSIECEVLLPSLALFADEHDSFQRFEPALSNANSRQHDADGKWVSGLDALCIERAEGSLGGRNVTEPYQNSSSCLSK
jgi:hypothetical protein